MIKDTKKKILKKAVSKEAKLESKENKKEEASETPAFEKGEMDDMPSKKYKNLKK
jgi:hypothetical protein